MPVLKKKVQKNAPKTSPKEEEVKQDEVVKEEKPVKKPLKKKASVKEEPVKEEKVAEEKPATKKPLKKAAEKKEEPKKAKVKKEEQKEEKPPVFEYPETFETKRGNIYTKVAMDFATLKNRVNNSKGFPVRLMVKEPNREKVSEFIVAAVISRVHLIDISSKDDDFESSFYATKEDIERMEFHEDIEGNGKVTVMPFALYEVTRKAE